jgi:iron-sulfur cluster assembly protein
MSSTVSESAGLVTISEKAANEIKNLFEQQGITNAALRVFVSGGGCSGLQYGMAISQEVEEGDTEFTQHDIRVLVDQISAPYLEGSTVDFIEDDMGGGFKIDNPNAVSSCGCGSSFATDEEGGSCGSCGCH